jgi:dUTP pyrophosphatase
LPEYQTEHSAGMDLHACIDEPITLGPLERIMVPTGIAIELQSGYEAQVRARSGLSIKHGITMVNGVGTIDADYRGEVCALVVNLSDGAFVIEPGMRIAQMVVCKYERVTWQDAASLGETKRGKGGMGSTGIKAPIDGRS